MSIVYNTLIMQLWYYLLNPRNAINNVHNLMRYYGVSTYPGWLDYVWNWSRTAIQPWMYNNFEANEIIPGLWLGNWQSASNLEKLREHGIKHIVCAIYGSYPAYPDEFHYKIVPLRDIPEQDMSDELLDSTADYIHQKLSNAEKVLVHCAAGRSRSASLIIAYLMKYHGHSFDSAKQHVKKQRDIIEPNHGFQHRLRGYMRRTQSCIF